MFGQKVCGAWMVLVVALGAFSLTAAEINWRPGGKLAGQVLPLYPTQHGEPAGYPGCVPELAAAEPGRFVPQGMAPKVQLHPDSVEHWSAYFFKYLPIRSMFDRQSLLHNWRATKLPAGKGQIEPYEEPVYWLIRHGKAVPTGRKNKPVDVVRVRPGAPAFELACGRLEPGLFCVRVIGAVETEHLQRHRRPLYMEMSVNDQIGGGETVYRMRSPYVDEFYGVTEMYFHAPEARDYRVKIGVEKGSKVDLLVYNLELHDALAGSERRPIKTRRTLSAGRQLVNEPSPKAFADADMLWHAFPPLNCHTRYVYGMGANDSKANWPNVGAGGLSAEEVTAEHGEWEWRFIPLGDVILKNKKLGLEYTMSDYRAGKPLPDPYPFKDRGMGIWTASANGDGAAQNLWPVPEGLGRRMRSYAGGAVNLAKQYAAKDDAEIGRRAAFMLVRIAYVLPAISARNSMHSVVIQPGSWGRDHGCRRRDPIRDELGDVLQYCEAYDLLFDLIRADQKLADAIHKYIPSVRTPEDVTELLDTYLVQTTAKRLLRYQRYSSNTPEQILTPANCLGDPVVTKPWLEWLFKAAFVYPLPLAGIQDLATSANDRNGIGYIASHYYVHGQQAGVVASKLNQYIALGGLAQFNLGDPAQYPKPLAACHWFFDSRTAGNYFPRIGDVCGPDKGYGHPIVYHGHKALISQCRDGWNWAPSAKFAWGLAKYDDPKNWDPNEWKKIKTAAATVTRAPWYENDARVFANWGGFLESGVEFSDDRYRRSVMIRVGQGWGHHHNDSMDLQLHALGYPMTIDGGQRPGYSQPGDRSTITHNLVEIDGKNWLGHSWITTLSDAEDVGYMRAQSEPPSNHPDVRLYSRQVALIDVDEGSPAGADGVFPKDARAPRSYVFDVQRVAGGALHSHAFHGMIEDEFVCNAEGQVKPETLTGDDLAYANRFVRDQPELPQSTKTFAGHAPDVLEATWRMTRTQQGLARTEESMHPAIWNPASPRKYTRLHLLGQKGARVISAWSHCKRWNYGYTNLYTQRRGENLESVFPAIIEPYAGEPFIKTRSLVTVRDNDLDARRAVAIGLTTVDGHQDLLFADGYPEKARSLDGGVQISAEFAHVSVDKGGVRTAAITGGTKLAHPSVSLTPEFAKRAAKVAAVDYAQKTMVFDSQWPAASLVAGRVFEVGVPGHWTTYTAKNARAEGKKTHLTVTEGAAFYLSRVLHVDAGSAIVNCGLGLPHNDKHGTPGVDKHWVASTEDGSRFWRAEYLGKAEDGRGYRFRLDGKIGANDFNNGKGLRLWEYGLGDSVRMASYAGLKRVADKVYMLSADVPCRVGLAAKALSWSADGKGGWKALAGTSQNGLLEVTVGTEMLAGTGQVWLRVE